MNLYHYSNAMYPTLKTLRAQGGLGEDELNKDHTESVRLGRIGAYVDHMSFFFEPLPLDVLGEVYGSEHKVWHSGSKLVQYTVPVQNLGSFKYEIVESPEKVALYYDESLSIEEYKSRLSAVKLEKDYVGMGKDRFEKAIDHLVGNARKAFLRVNKFKDWESTRDKYAANVPHAMTYPRIGEIKYTLAHWVQVK